MLKELFIQTMLRYSISHEYAEECWVELKSRYSEEWRCYHTLDHISSMINELEQVKESVENYDALLFSIFYHDVVYEIGATDNETQSAELLAKRLKCTSFKSTDLCRSYIEHTAGHGSAVDDDCALFLDIDLSVLGKSWDEYEIYMKSIRQEYISVPETQYREGRVAILESFLKLQIYKSEYYSNRYEQQARSNILREIEML